MWLLSQTPVRELMRPFVIVLFVFRRWPLWSVLHPNRILTPVQEVRRPPGDQEVCPPLILRQGVVAEIVLGRRRVVVGRHALLARRSPVAHVALGPAAEGSRLPFPIAHRRKHSVEIWIPWIQTIRRRRRRPKGIAIGVSE